MEQRKNLCAQVPISLHDRVTEAREQLGQTTAEYITNVLTEYYEMRENGGKETMANGKNRTLAFQIDEELFQRIKAHLDRESARLGRKVTQREFVLNAIIGVLNMSEPMDVDEGSVAPCEAPTDQADPSPRRRSKRRHRPACGPCDSTVKTAGREPPGAPRQGCSGGLFAFSKEVNITRTSTRFTPEEMDVAKGTDLPDLLSHLGYRVRRVGSFYSTKEMDSLMIKDRRRWRRYSTGQGGDAITFLQEFCGKSFPEAVNYLLDFNGHRARDSPLGQKFRKRSKYPLPCHQPIRTSAGCSPTSRSGASPPGDPGLHPGRAAV